MDHLQYCVSRVKLKETLTHTGQKMNFFQFLFQFLKEKKIWIVSVNSLCLIKCKKKKKVCVQCPEFECSNSFKWKKPFAIAMKSYVNGQRSKRGQLHCTPCMSSRMLCSIKEASTLYMMSQFHIINNFTFFNFLFFFFYMQL